MNLKKIYLLPVVLFASMNANAAMVNFELTGLVDYADTGNAFSLSMGDFVFSNGRFDDSSLLGGEYETVSFGLSAGNNLVVNVGSVILDEKSDTSYTAGFPKIEFTNGKFSGINFDSTGIFGLQTFAASNSYLQSFGDFVNGEDENYNLITATWQLESYTVVPLPAAFWLFGIGLLSLFGMNKRLSLK